MLDVVPFEPARKVLSPVLYRLCLKDSVSLSLLHHVPGGSSQTGLMELGIKGLKLLSQSRIFN